MTTTIFQRAIGRAFLCLLCLPLLLLTGCPTGTTYTVDIEKLRAAAEQGDRDAQSELGSCYFYGRGIDKDDTEAVKWLQIAAKQGQTDAQYQLGLCYLIGAGVPQDKEEAIKWYIEAGKSGHAGVFFVLQRLELNNESPFGPNVLRGSTYERNGKPFSIQLPEQDRNAATMQHSLSLVSHAGVIDALDTMYLIPFYIDFAYPKVSPLTPAVARKYNVADQTCIYVPAKDTIYVSSAATLFAFNHEFGQKLNKDIAKSTGKLHKAAERGNAAAQFELGECYSNGLGVPQNTEEAVRLFRLSAEQGNAQGQFHLGISYGSDIAGSPENQEEAMKWIRKSAEQGYPEAVELLDAMDRQDAESAYSEAVVGDADAQYQLGMHFIFGDGVSQNYKEGVEWLRKSAEQGHAEAQYELSVCYRQGESVPQNDLEAVKWIRMAAEQGLDRAQSNLGMYYLRGIGVSKDLEVAINWLRKAAEQGNDRGQCIFGECYLNGEGVPQDEVEAVKWFRKSAEQEYAGAQYNLGECYFYGKGVPENKTEGVNWWRKAAEQGNARGQFSLGVCYFNGEGIAQNQTEGINWIRKAAGQGNTEAIDALRKIGIR